MIFIKSRLHSRGQRFLHPLWHDLVVIRISKFFFKKGLSSSLTSCASRLEFQSRRPVQEAGVREKTSLYVCAPVSIMIVIFCN